MRLAAISLSLLVNAPAEQSDADLVRDTSCYLNIIAAAVRK